MCDEEWALIQGHWPPHLSHALAQDTVEGNFADVLTSPAARALLTVPDAEHDAEPTFATAPTPDAELARICVGVACLHAFIQLNWTGPDLDLQPAALLTPPHAGGDDDLTQRAIAALAYGGEPAYHLAHAPVLLLWALRIFAQPYAHTPSAPWWTLRAETIRQYVLDEPVPLPPAVLAALDPLAADLAAHPDPDLLGRLLLEQGLLHHLFANDRTAATLFVRAARATGLEYELTGAMGKRTKFQQTELSQLVVLAESRPRDSDDEEGGGTDNGEAAPPAEAVPETLALNDDTLLEQTEFTSSTSTSTSAPSTRLAHLDPASQPPLHPLDQCILLALCLNVKNTSPTHGLTAAQMYPYVARVLAHPRNWSVHTMALLLRARLESARTRTVERATLQLQALVDQMPSADAPLAVRLRFVHATPLPSRWRLERELAHRFLALGVTRSALAIFERLELWHDVVACWQSLERPERGVAIVRDLLEGRKAPAPRRAPVPDPARTAKLWCILGDLEPAHARAHYAAAWAASHHTSARAMRALGGVHFAHAEYADAAECLRRAAAISPLQPRTWFVLGCACVRLEEWPGARDAFARCVALDDEDAESWSNLASVYLRMGEDAGARGGSEEGVEEGAEEGVADPYAYKHLAFRALRQGLKFSYENWRMWANYTTVATDVGELPEAARALARVVELRAVHDGAACADAAVVERLVAAVTAGPAPSAPDAPPAPGSLHARVRVLFEETLRPRVASARLSRAYARLLAWEGRWAAARAAHLEAYRAGPAAGVPADVEAWRAGVEAVREVVDVLRNLGEGARWRGQARGVVRTYMARARDWEGEPEWGVLEGLVEELRGGAEAEAEEG